MHGSASCGIMKMEWVLWNTSKEKRRIEGLLTLIPWIWVIRIEIDGGDGGKGKVLLSFFPNEWDEVIWENERKRARGREEGRERKFLKITNWSLFVSTCHLGPSYQLFSNLSPFSQLFSNLSPFNSLCSQIFSLRLLNISNWSFKIN